MTVQNLLRIVVMPNTSPYTKLLSKARPVIANNGRMIMYKKFKNKSKNAARSSNDWLSVDATHAAPHVAYATLPLV